MQTEFDSCDGALWQITNTKNSTELDATVYKYKDRYIEPDDLGYKYHILTYKGDDYSSADVICAYIGDVRYFIDNHAKAGYNGLMVKDKAVPRKEIKNMFKLILSNWQFPTNIIKEVVKKV